MTIKKCDKCGKVYKKGYLLAYSLNGCEVGKAEGVLKPEYAVTKDLCETCATRLKMFLRSKEEEIKENDSRTGSKSVLQNLNRKMQN